MPKKEKLSQNEEWLRLKNRMSTLDLMEMPSKLHPKNMVPFDFGDAKYKADTGEILPALNKYKKLIAVPKEIRNGDDEIIYKGWCYEKNPIIKNTSFVNHALYCEYRMYAAKLIAEFYLRKAQWWAKKMEVTYNQEYGGMFVSFKGRAYYAFDRKLNCPPESQRILYNPSYPLDFCWDFNRIPGNCAISQELPAPEWLIERNQNQNRGLITAVIDEIFITSDSNTEKVCDKLIERWGHHRNLVQLYGDATGGAKKSSQVRGSDWDIIKNKFDGVFNYDFCVKKSNPRVRVRINAVNSRLVAADGFIGTIIDTKCRNLIRDLESVTCDDAGDLNDSDKKSLLTHISDGFGYKIAEVHPIGGDIAYAEGSF